MEMLAPALINSSSSQAGTPISSLYVIHYLLPNPPGNWLRLVWQSQEIILSPDPQSLVSSSPILGPLGILAQGTLCHRSLLIFFCLLTYEPDTKHTAWGPCFKTVTHKQLPRIFCTANAEEHFCFVWKLAAGYSAQDSALVLSSESPSNGSPVGPHAQGSEAGPLNSPVMPNSFCPLSNHRAAPASELFKFLCIFPTHPRGVFLLLWSSAF